VNEMRTKLERRTDAERKTAKGRQDTVIFGQTKEYLRPFFSKLKDGVCFLLVRSKLLDCEQANCGEDV
jgi:hypothetical protein